MEAKYQHRYEYSTNLRATIYLQIDGERTSQLRSGRVEDRHCLEGMLRSIKRDSVEGHGRQLGRR